VPDADVPCVDLDELLAPGALRTAFQPIVELDGGSVVGYEALARWPELGVDPQAAFAAAEDAGRVPELDWACRVAALRTALDSDTLGTRSLFVNIEPMSVGSPTPAAAADLLSAARNRFPLTLELTERALFTQPAELMRTVDAAREAGWGIALDDVGADPASLSMLPFLAPDVIKLDISLIQRAPNRAQAQIMAAVAAHAERTGAAVLAEGIETPAHVERALSLGAQFGQGWYFGRPGALEAARRPASPIPLAQAYGTVPETPFDLVAGSPALRIGRKSLVLALSRHLEDQGLGLSVPPILMSAFQSAEQFPPAAARRYARIATRCPLVGALGGGLSTTPTPGVRGADLAPGDRLRDEWAVVVVSDHYAGALIARDLADDADDLDRRFEFVVTHDRETVLAAGRSLMRRLLPDGR
jgi:EAL domain-containing protein (putative c-di-GMP-specific phosphodiesterase class I)